MRSTTCLEPRLPIFRRRNGRTKRRRSFTPQSLTLNQRYADSSQYVTQILTFLFQCPLDLCKARIVARIMAGDPSRGAMSVETEEEVKKGSHIVVSPRPPQPISRDTRMLNQDVLPSSSCTGQIRCRLRTRFAMLPTTSLPSWPFPRPTRRLISPPQSARELAMSAHRNGSSQRVRMES